MIDALRSTLLGLWHKCPLQVWMVGTHGYGRPSGAMYAGTCAHKTVETNFRQKIESDEDLYVSEMNGIFEEAFDANKDPIDGQVPVWKGDERGELKRRFLGNKTSVGSAGRTVARRGLIEHFADAVCPSINPLHVEQRLETELPLPERDGGGTVRLHGTVDCVATIGGKTHIIDWKFRKRLKSADEAKLSDQLTTYDLLWRASGNPKPDGLLQGVSTYGTGEPNYHPLRASRTVRQIAEVKAEYLGMWKSLQVLGDRPELYPKAARDSWVCSDSWCSWWKKCVRGGGNYYEAKKITKKKAAPKRNGFSPGS